MDKFRMQKIKAIKTILAGLALVFSFAGNAALVKNIDGFIIGFNGVDFDGKSYNVKFDGRTCADVYDGCDSTDDFFFQDYTTGLAASATLAETMFNALVSDSFINNRINVSSILGCTVFCDLLTPYTDELPTQFGVRVTTANLQSGNPNIPSSFGTNDNLSVFAGFASFTGTNAEDMWVVWEEATSVSAPSTLIILTLGLMGLVARRLKK